MIRVHWDKSIPPLYPLVLLNAEAEQSPFYPFPTRKPRVTISTLTFNTGEITCSIATKIFAHISLSGDHKFAN
jgi:hypothetical protein